MTVSWKLFWSVLCTVLTLAVAGMTSLFGVTPLVVIPVFVVAAIVFSLGAGRVVHGSVTFRDMSQQAKSQVVWLIRTGAALHVAWVVAFEIRPDLWPAWILALAVLGALEYGTARGHEYLLTQLRPVMLSKEAKAAEKERRNLGHEEKVFAAALDRSGHGRLKLLNSEPIGDEDDPHGMRFRVRVPPQAAGRDPGGEA